MSTTPTPSAAERRLAQARATLEAAARCAELAPALDALMARDEEAQRAGERARRARDRAAADAARAHETRRALAAEARALLAPVVAETGQASLVAALTGVPAAWLAADQPDSTRPTAPDPAELDQPAAV